MMRPAETTARPQPGSRRSPTAPLPAPLPQPAEPRLFGANGRRVLFVVLVCLWGLILMTRWPSHQPSAVPAAVSPSAKALGSPTGVLPPLPRLKRELVDLPHAPYIPETTSIFAVRPTPPPPVRPVEVVRPAAPPPSPPPDPFQEAAKQLRFVGFMQAGETVTALISQGSEVHIVAVGETLAGRFRVASVTEESVLLTSPEADRQVRLSLQEVAPPGAPGPKR